MIFPRDGTMAKTDNLTGKGISLTKEISDKDQGIVPTTDDATSETQEGIGQFIRRGLSQIFSKTDTKKENDTITQTENTDTERAKVNGVIRFKYWIPKPTLASWRFVGMVFVNIATATGLCSFAILGFAFAQIGDVSETLRWWLILVGSISMAIGSEVGTLVTVVEIFRKQKSVSRQPLLARVLISILATARSIRVVIDALSRIYKDPVEKSFKQAIKMIESSLKSHDKGAVAWDWIGLGISIMTSLSAVALAQVSILQLAGNEAVYQWLPTIRQWSPAALALFGVLDGCVNHAEFGLALASLDEQVRRWYVDRESARRELMEIAMGKTRKKRGKKNV